MTACPDLGQTAKAVKMSLPVGGIDTRVLDRVAAVDHHAVANIDGHMGGSCGVIRALEEDQVSGLGFASRDNSADVLQSVCRQSSDVPSVSTVIDNPADKAGAVKARGRGRSAPDIGVSKILLSLGDHLPELFIRQSFTGDVVVQHILDSDSVGIISEDLRLIAERLHQESVTRHLFIRESC